MYVTSVKKNARSRMIAYEVCSVHDGDLTAVSSNLCAHVHVIRELSLKVSGEEGLP